MGVHGRVQVSVSRSIDATAATIFEVLADPVNHPALDGSGMLRPAPAQAVPGRQGDTFTMRMYLPELGDYLMLNRVTAFERNRTIVWEPTPGDAAAAGNAGLPVGERQGYSWGFTLEPNGDVTLVTEVFDCTEADQAIRDAVEDGRTWIPAMRQTLERLAAMIERQLPDALRPAPASIQRAGPRVLRLREAARPGPHPGTARSTRPSGSSGGWRPRTTTLNKSMARAVMDSLRGIQCPVQ